MRFDYSYLNLSIPRGTSMPMNPQTAATYDSDLFGPEGENYASQRAKRGLPASSAKRLANGLGWFSVGLGLAELLAPRAIANISGVSNTHTGLIRLYGARELASGIAIFAQEKPTEAVWARVAGDALDLVSLGIAG